MSRTGSARAAAWTQRIVSLAGVPSSDALGREFLDRMGAVLESADLHANPGPMIAELARICANRHRTLVDFPTIAPANTPSGKVVAIVGLPRAGTSFLQNVLAFTCNLATPRAFDMLFASSPTQQRRAKAGERTRRAYLSSPDLSRTHRLPIGGPDECATGLLNHLSGLLPGTMWSSQFLSFLDVADDITPMTLHLSVAMRPQHVRHAQAVLLKSPDHVFRIDELRRLSPGAKFIFVDRPMDDVMASWMRLVAAARVANGSSLEPTESIRFRMMWQSARDTALSLKSDSTVVISHGELIRDPVRTIYAIADQCELDVSSNLVSTTAKLQRWGR